MNRSQSNHCGMEILTRRAFNNNSPPDVSIEPLWNGNLTNFSPLTTTIKSQSNHCGMEMLQLQVYQQLEEHLFQSNHCGMEIARNPSHRGDLSWFQSNHCGMEIPNEASFNEFCREVSIEPLWNGNLSRIEPLKREGSFNRTIVEWKSLYSLSLINFLIVSIEPLWNGNANNLAWEPKGTRAVSIEPLWNGNFRQSLLVASKLNWSQSNHCGMEILFTFAYSKYPL